jgi:hypothetical protein
VFPAYEGLTWRLRFPAFNASTFDRNGVGFHGLFDDLFGFLVFRQLHGSTFLLVFALG